MPRIPKYKFLGITRAPIGLTPRDWRIIRTPKGIRTTRGGRIHNPHIIGVNLTESINIRKK